VRLHEPVAARLIHREVKIMEKIYFPHLDGFQPLLSFVKSMDPVLEVNSKRGSDYF